MVEFNYKTTRFDEAFLYLVKSHATWPIETRIFPPDKIENIADMVCQFTDNQFASTFANGNHFKHSFGDALQMIMWEHIQGEKRYRLHKDRFGAKGNKKAVTQAKLDVEHMLKGLTEHSDFLSHNSEKAGAYLESLRRPCRETTLRLLDYMSFHEVTEPLSYIYPFTFKVWTSTKISEMERHLRAVGKILLVSKTRGGQSAASISPVISNLVFELAYLYLRYSAKMPTRGVAVDTNAPPRHGKNMDKEAYRETSPFKRFCFKAYELVVEQLERDEELQDLKHWNTFDRSPNCLDRAIRNAIKQLKELGLTHP